MLGGLELGLILGDLDHYWRQCIGLIDASGRKQILVRCFANPEGDRFPNWRQEFVIVSDGGADFWYAVFDLETGQLQFFQSNGYA